MASDDYNKPEARHVTDFERSDLTGNLKSKIIPNKTIKVFRQLLTTGAGIDFPSGTVTDWTPSGTAPLLLTHMRVACTKTAERLEFIWADRDGTFDVLTVGTAVGGNLGVVAGWKDEVRVQGAVDAPIHVVLGTLHIYTGGSTAAGTYNMSYEGVQR